MLLWFIQILFNFSLGALGLMWFRTRKRLERVELELETLRRTKTEPSLEPEIPKKQIQEFSVEEKNKDRRPLDAYERANDMISRGLSLREVSRQTGLSLSELQLIGKLSQRNH